MKLIINRSSYVFISENAEADRAHLIVSFNFIQTVLMKIIRAANSSHYSILYLLTANYALPSLNFFCLV